MKLRKQYREMKKVKFSLIIKAAEMKKYILRPKKLSAQNKKSSELNLKNNVPNQNQVK